jgi:hypothetical protein
MTFTKVVFPEFWIPTRVSSISSFQKRLLNHSGEGKKGEMRNTREGGRSEHVVGNLCHTKEKRDIRSIKEKASQKHWNKKSAQAPQSVGGEGRGKLPTIRLKKDEKAILVGVKRRFGTKKKFLKASFFFFLLFEMDEGDQAAQGTPPSSSEGTPPSAQPGKHAALKLFKESPEHKGASDFRGSNPYSSSPVSAAQAALVEAMVLNSFILRLVLNSFGCF